MDNSSLAHSKWNCKYHIVFAPKYRRQVIYGKIKADIGRILRELCEHKKVEIIEANACKDHIHMLVSIPPKLSVAQFMWYLKGKSSLMIFDRHANLKYRYCIWAIEFKTIYWPVYGWGGKRKQKKHLLGAACKSMRLANCFSVRVAQPYRCRTNHPFYGWSWLSLLTFLSILS